MKIVASYGVEPAEAAMARLREVAEIKSLLDMSRETLLAEVRDADAILASPIIQYDRELFEAAGRLKIIARGGVGVDNIDVKAATARGVFVTNGPGMTADSVAEFTMSLLLSLAKNIPRCDRAVREGRWNERRQLVRENIELNGKTHGIVGLGRIGHRVAVRCKAFGMRVLYFKRNRDLDLEQTLGVEYVPFDTLVRECDSISLHTPLTEETANLFTRERFATMKPTCLLINQARGKVVNEADLFEALREGRIGGYATDVYEQEPPDTGSDLFRFKNVIVAPHLGGVTRESMVRSSMSVADNVLAALRGEVPKNLVNRDVLERRSA